MEKEIVESKEDQITDDIVNDLVENIRLALVNYQNIVPVIGYDTIPIRVGNTTFPYLDFLASKIAHDNQIVIKDKLIGFELFNEISHQLLIKNEFDRLKTTRQISKYAKNIHSLVDKTYLEKIVTIFPFRYFLNLTFTTHLHEIVEGNRNFPKIAVNESSFPFILKNPKRPDDLKKSECSFVATIYNLFGTAYQKQDEMFNYYYSDDDMLSFISEFSKRFDVELKNYKEVIKESSLLFLGCQYPDWLLRVLINTLSPGSLDFRNRMQTRVFVDYCNDDSTILFLNKHKLQFQRALRTLPFVNSLHNVLAENKFAINISKRGAFAFISYSRDDLSVVQKIVCQLSSYVTLWFDKNDLSAGDLINNDIKKAIDNCKLFLPIITQNTVRKPATAYVKQEWIHYIDNFRSLGKVIPLVARDVNLGELGFNIDQNFSSPGNNLFYIHFDETGLTEDMILQIQNRI